MKIGAITRLQKARFSRASSARRIFLAEYVNRLDRIPGFSGYIDISKIQ